MQQQQSQRGQSSQKQMNPHTLNLNEQVDRINSQINAEFSQRQKLSKELQIYDPEQRFETSQQNVNQLYNVP